MKFTKKDFIAGLPFKIKKETGIFKCSEGLIYIKYETVTYSSWLRYGTVGNVNTIIFDAYMTFLNRPIMTTVLFSDCEHAD